MKKIEKLNLDEFEYVGQRFDWEDEWDLGAALRRIEFKLNQVIDAFNELASSQKKETNG